MAAEAGQLQLNVMEPVIGQAMFESIHILSNACYNLLEKCVNGITANKEVCEGYVYNSIGIVTYLNPFIGPTTATSSVKSVLKPVRAYVKLCWSAAC